LVNAKEVDERNMRERDSERERERFGERNAEVQRERVWRETTHTRTHTQVSIRRGNEAHVVLLPQPLVL